MKQKTVPEFAGKKFETMGELVKFLRDHTFLKIDFDGLYDISVNIDGGGEIIFAGGASRIYEGKIIDIEELEIGRFVKFVRIDKNTGKVDSYVDGDLKVKDIKAI